MILKVGVNYMELTKDALYRLYCLYEKRNHAFFDTFSWPNLFNNGYWPRTRDEDEELQILGLVKIRYDEDISETITRIRRAGIRYIKKLPPIQHGLFFAQYNINSETHRYIDQRYKPLVKIFNKLEKEQFPVFFSHENTNVIKLAKRTYNKRFGIQ